MFELFESLLVFSLEYFISPLHVISTVVHNLCFLFAFSLTPLSCLAFSQLSWWLSSSIIEFSRRGQLLNPKMLYSKLLQFGKEQFVHIIPHTLHICLFTHMTILVCCHELSSEQVSSVSRVASQIEEGGIGFDMILKSLLNFLCSFYLLIKYRK